MKALYSGLRQAPVDTFSGPLSPRYASPPRARGSALRKYGRPSGNDQFGNPPVFGLAKVWQAIGIGPVGQPRATGPALVVQRVATDVDHAVDRRGAAQHPP